MNIFHGDIFCGGGGGGKLWDGRKHWSQYDVSHNMEPILINGKVVLKELTSLKMNKSAGPDCIHPYIIEQSCVNLFPYCSAYH